MYPSRPKHTTAGVPPAAPGERRQRDRWHLSNDEQNDFSSHFSPTIRQRPKELHRTKRPVDLRPVAAGPDGMRYPSMRRERRKVEAILLSRANWSMRRTTG